MQQPNVLLIVLDTARASDALDADVMPTLVDLGRQGATYRTAIASAPWTLPSHASLFTGTYPSRHGAHGDHPYLDGELDTLAAAYSTAGYETIGITNNTWITREFGLDRGFDTFWKGWQYVQSGTDLGVIAHELGTSEKLRVVRERLFDGNPAVNLLNLAYSEFVQPATDDGASRTTDQLRSWLTRRDPDRPFFGFVNYLEPHITYRPPREHAMRFLPDDAGYEEAVEVRQDPCAYNVGAYDLPARERRMLHGLYRGELAYVDEHLARVVDALKTTDQWNDTILVVAGDHGENIGEHGLLGHQYAIYDTLLHVPLVVTGGAFNGQGTLDDLVQLPDIVPTLLDATEIDAPMLRDQHQGVSFYPDTAADERRVAIAEYISPQPSVARLEEQFGPLPDAVSAYDRTLRAIRTRSHKLIVGSDGLEELYHIAGDPTERTDRSAAATDTVREFRDRLDDWLGSFQHATAGPQPTMSSSTRQRLEQLGYL